MFLVIFFVFVVLFFMCLLLSILKSDLYEFFFLFGIIVIDIYVFNGNVYVKVFCDLVVISIE